MSAILVTKTDAPVMLVSAIESASSEQLDTLWSILKPFNACNSTYIGTY